VQVVDEQMSNLDSLHCLGKGIFVAVDLGENGTVLHFELAIHLELSHAVGDRLFFDVELLKGNVVKCLLNT
jgi:hypothetical protein